MNIREAQNTITAAVEEIISKDDFDINDASHYGHLYLVLGAIKEEVKRKVLQGATTDTARLTFETWFDSIDQATRDHEATTKDVQ